MVRLYRIPDFLKQITCILLQTYALLKMCKNLCVQNSSLLKCSETFSRRELSQVQLEVDLEFPARILHSQIVGYPE